MKRLLRILTFCLAAALCLVLIVLAMLGTGPGLRLTASLVSGVVSSADTKIEISGLDGVLSGTSSVEAITIADAEGTWLALRDVKVDLSRWSLLAGNIAASRLSVDAVDVARRPVPGETGDGGGAMLPQIQARVDNIFVRAIALAEPVLGEAATLQLTGSLLLDDRPVDLSGVLELVRIDGRSGEIAANWKVSPESNELQLDLTAREPANGLLARAIDIHGLPAVDVSVAGSGPLDDWQATLSVNLNGEKTVDGSVSLAFTDEKQTVSGVLEGQLAPLMPSAATPFFAGNTHIELSAERDGENTYRINTFSARSALVALRASGHILPGTDLIDLRADLTFGAPDSEIALDLSPGVTLSIGHTHIETALKGSLQKADWTLAGSIQSFSDGTRSFTGAELSGQSSSIDFLAGAGPLAITAQFASFSSGQDSLDTLVGGPVSANITADIADGHLSIRESLLTAHRLKAEATGRVDPVRSEFDLRLAATIDARNLSPWDGLLGQQEARLSGRASRGEDGVLVLSDIALGSGNLLASAKGSLSAEALQFDADLSLTTLNSLNAGLDGGLSATIVLTGSPDAPQFDLRAEGDDITVLGEPLEGFLLEATGVSGSTGPTADLKLTGRYENQPISVTAGVKAGSDGSPLVETLDVVVPGARATGSLRANAAGILVGTFDLDVSSLADLGPLLLQDGLSGALSGTVEFAERDAVQSIQSTLTAQTLEINGLQLSGTDISALITDPQNALAIDATVSNTAVTVSGTSIRKVQSRISGTPQAVQFSVDGFFQGDPISVAGEVSSQHGTTLLEIDKASGRIASIPVELAEPATITLADEATRLETLTLQVGQGRITVSGTMTPQLSFDVDVRGLPLGPLETVAPTGLGQSGTVNAAARITGTPSDPQVSYNLAIADFSVAASRESQIPPIAIEASGTFASNVLKTSAKATGGGMNLTAGGTVNVAGTPTLDLTVTGTTPFEFAAIPLSKAGILLEGGVTVSLAITGTAQSPQIKGRLTTQNAVFIEENSSLTIRDIAGEIDFDGTRANIVSLTGRMGTKGALSATGYVDLDAVRGLPADLKLTVSDGTYSNGEIITTQFDAEMSVSGALLRTGAIGGTVTLQRTDINVPERLPASIPLVDVRHRHASQAVAAQAREIAPSTGDSGEEDTGGVLQLDLTVSAPARIFLRGRGIDAEFSGSLQVTGTVSAPVAKGSFQMIRGRLDVLNRRFDFDRGSITFAGPMDPNLDFQTTTTVSGASYSIIVDGTASAPEISFTSSPTVPQDEILANLFFGKDLSKLSPLQIAQLANAVSQLGGVNSGEGLLGRLRSLGGLADVNISPDDTGDGTALGIGSYLNDRTYINVEKGLSGGSGKVTIDVDLTEHLKARGEASSDGETKAGIFYQRDY